MDSNETTAAQTAPKGPTLCWDCANALGFCNWSQRLEPVEGWDAQWVPDKETYHVSDCPLFIRDAVGGGLKRYKPDEQEKKEGDGTE